MKELCPYSQTYMTTQTLVRRRVDFFDTLFFDALLRVVLRADLRAVLRAVFFAGLRAVFFAGLRAVFFVAFFRATVLRAVLRADFFAGLRVVFFVARFFAAFFFAAMTVYLSTLMMGVLILLLLTSTFAWAHALLRPRRRYTSVVGRRLPRLPYGY